MDEMRYADGGEYEHKWRFLHLPFSGLMGTRECMDTS